MIQAARAANIPVTQELIEMGEPGHGCDCPTGRARTKFLADRKAIVNQEKTTTRRYLPPMVQ